MKISRLNFSLSLLVFFLVIFSLHVPARAADHEVFDHSLFDRFLKKNISEQGELNLEKAPSDSALLEEYLAALKTQDSKRIAASWSREEQLAFWLNAYHAGVIHQILNSPDTRTVKDIPGIWTYPVIQVGKEGYSLNSIRSVQLMQGFRDEKMNAALACGARSCPPFPREAFSALRVEGQLFLAATNLANDERFVQVDGAKHKLYLARIFKWYASDFILDFGRQNDLKFTPPEMAVLSFLRHYLQDAGKIDFLEALDFKIKYMEFDWRPYVVASSGDSSGR